MKGYFLKTLYQLAMKRKLILLAIIAINWIVLLCSDGDTNIYTVPIFMLASIIFFFKKKYNKMYISFLPLAFLIIFYSILTSISYVLGRGTLSGGYVGRIDRLDYEYRVYHTNGSCIPMGVFDWLEDYKNFLLKGLIPVIGYQKNSYKGYLPGREFIENISTENALFSDYRWDEKLDTHKEILEIINLKKEIIVPISLYSKCVEYNENQNLKYKVLNNELLILIIKNDLNKLYECMILIDYKNEKYIDFIRRRNNDA